MNFTLVDLSSSLLAISAFAVFLLPPAYLYLRFTGVAQMRSRSGVEQLLWITAFSLPLSLFLTSVVGRFVSTSLLTGLYLAVGLGTAFVGLPHAWRKRTRVRAVFAEFWPVGLALLGFVAYVLLITTSIDIHGHLYESVNYTDWSVRLPMVNAAIRNGTPPGNPFFTLGSEPQPSRYYYYWYELCAAVGRPLHLPARACLSASAVWSGFALIAVLFLALRRLLHVSPRTVRGYLFPLLLCCVMGVDVLAAVLGYLLRPPIIYPEIEWWLDDRIPSFAGAVIFAPHHIAGVVCCMVAFLFLFVSRAEAHGPGKRLPRGFAKAAIASITAAICFAACAGDSTFVALCFTLAAVLYALDLIRHARWGDLAVLAAAGVIALCVSVPFLREITVATPGVASGHGHVLQFALRNRREKEHFAGVLVRATHGWLHQVLYVTIAPVFLLAQFGFFLVPLCMRVRLDIGRLRAGERLPDGERFLWAIFLGAALPGFFLSSAPQGVNDLGRHAGLIWRLVLVAWSVPLLWPYWQRWHNGQPLSLAHPWIARVATALFGVGLASQFWQIASGRGLMVFLGHHPHVFADAPVSHEADVGARFYQLRRGLDAVEARLPPGAIVQSNLTGPFQVLVMLYSSHPFAAGDATCVYTFGGDPRLCAPMASDLHVLFYTSAAIPSTAHVPYRRFPPLNPAFATVGTFEEACRRDHLGAVVVQNSDLVWTAASSWVWQMHPLYASSLVRIFGCPAYFSGATSVPAVTGSPS